jgi:hypothetical protein
VAVQAWFAGDDLGVCPGELGSLTLSVENLGDQGETYAIIPAGFSAGWITVTRPTVTLFAGSREIIEVVVRPPKSHTTSAGPTTAAVRIVPAADADAAILVETDFEVLPFDDRRLGVLQPMQRARRRAAFEFMVENRGNELASCRLYLIDPTGRLDGSFDPPAVGVAPGSSSLVRLRARSTQRRFRRSDEQLPFTIEATEPDHEPATGTATMVQPPTVPAMVMWRSAGVVLALAALVGLWFTVVRPEIDQAARRAVQDQTTQIAVAPTGQSPRPGSGVGPSSPAVTASIEDLPGTRASTPLVTRLTVRASADSSSSEEYTIPQGSRFELSDVVLQNAQGDQGIAQLSRNDEVIYEWDLGLMSLPNEFQPRVTPIPFEPGDSLTARVTCEIPGNPTANRCDVGILIGGRLIDS